MIEFGKIEREIEKLQNDPAACTDPHNHLLALAEQILENWLAAHDLEPTQDTREGYRLLALHHQGAQGNPSFNACRETCRELIYQLNLYRLRRDVRQLQLSAMVAKHLLLFIKGKMEVQELGEFCCSAKPLRM